MSDSHLPDSLFIQAALSSNTLMDRPPVWMMRQAGRFMPEYKKIKEKHDFLTMCKTPELAADVTMLPVDLLGVDAAILFSDILVTAQAMGGVLSFHEGVGPVFANPVRCEKDINALKESDACIEQLDYVAGAIKEVQIRLKEDKARNIPLIGFAGAPFTVMSYLVEGRASTNFKETKQLLHNNNPEIAHKLLRKLATLTTEYLKMQIDAGVDAVQIFDSWANALCYDDYKEFSHQYIVKIILGIREKYPNIPIISFCKGSSVFAPLMAEAKPDVLSIDWNADLRTMQDSLPAKIAVQGNLDPCVLYADQSTIKRYIYKLLTDMCRKDEQGNKLGCKGFIFNLGHGIMPDIPFEKVKYAIELIKEFTYNNSDSSTLCTHE